MALPQPQTPFSADDFLAWDATQTERQEFVDGEVFAMADGEDRHASVSLAVASSLRSHLKGSRRRVYMNDDRGDKFANCRLCPTLAEYALIDIDRRAVGAAPLRWQRPV